MEPESKPKKEIYDEWHNDSSNWRMGIFYFNKKDKRIFPPKRIKYLGWTVNFANPYSVLTIVAVIILFIAIVVFANYIE